MSQSDLFLLDTNILSTLIRQPQGVVAEKLAELGEDRVCTSIIVASELRFGAHKRGSPRLTAQVEAILEVIDIRPLDIPSEIKYARLRWHLEKVGTSIGPNDMLIAAHALALEAVLVTANYSAFSRVPNLTIENWLS